MDDLLEAVETRAKAGHAVISGTQQEQSGLAGAKQTYGTGGTGSLKGGWL